MTARLARTTVIALLLCGLSAQAAQAGTASISPDGQTLRFVGGNENNSLLLTLSSDGSFLMRDEAGTRAGRGCTAVRGVVRCPGANIQTLLVQLGDGLNVATLTGRVERVVYDGGSGRDDVEVNPDSSAAFDIELFAGNDRFEGGNGGGTVSAGPDVDVVTTGSGDDTVRGQGGPDILDAGRGSDTISGEGATTVYARHTEPVVVRLNGDRDDGAAGELDQVLTTHVAGGPRDDRLIGNGAGNRLEGGEGADRLDGGRGDDVLNGGGGADTFLGGDDFDTVSYEERPADAPVRVELDDDGPSGESGEGDRIPRRDIEIAVGGAGDDALDGTGGPRGHVLEGGAGNDTLQGSGVFDRLVGGEGNDVIFGGEGGDRMVGGPGSDFLDGQGNSAFTTFTDSAIYEDSPAAVRAEMAGLPNGDGFVTDGHGTTDRLVATERVVGSAHDDTLIGSNNTLPNFEVLEGGGGNDTLMGLGGPDRFRGGPGDDAMDGGENESGSAGADGVSYSEAPAGVEITLPGGGSDGDGGTDSLANIEFLAGSNHDDVLIGSDGPENISGLDGSDTIEGRGERDVLSGGEGNDTIDGGFGRDNIDGGPGSDIGSYVHERKLPVTASTAPGFPAGSDEDGPEGFRDTLAGIETLQAGAPLGDVLTADNGASDGGIVDLGGANDVLSGGPFDDLLVSVDGNPDSIDCKDGDDDAVIDLRDTVANTCETVLRAPRDQHPVTRISTRSLTLRDGRAGLRLYCPKTSRSRVCSGRLQVEARRRVSGRPSSLRLGSTRYGIRRGAVEVVPVKIHRARLARAGRSSRLVAEAREKDPQGRDKVTLVRLSRARR